MTHSQIARLFASCRVLGIETSFYMWDIQPSEIKYVSAEIGKISEKIYALNTIEDKIKSIFN